MERFHSKSPLFSCQPNIDKGIVIVTYFVTLAAPLAAQTSPQQYRICNDRPARPVWMDEVHPREAYKALTLMRLYELRSWEAIKETGDCGCDVRFPSWDGATVEYEERFATSTQAEHTQARLAIRNEQNQIARDVQDICEAQGNW